MNSHVIKIDSSNAHVAYKLNKALAKAEGQEDLFTVSSNQYSAAFSEPGAILRGYIFFENEEPIGFYLYCYKFATYLGAKVLFVEDVYLTKGHDLIENKSKLLEHAIEKAQQEDCARIELRVLHAFNIGYDMIGDIGFSVVDKWDVYRRSLT